MKTKSVIFAAVLIFAATMGSCSQDSIAEEDQLYGESQQLNPQAIDKEEIDDRDT